MPDIGLPIAHAADPPVHAARYAFLPAFSLTLFPASSPGERSHMDPRSPQPLAQREPPLSSWPRRDHMKTHITQYEYLMHAILGLAASELIGTDTGLVEAAMLHRLQALRAIKRRLSSIAPSSSQARLYPPSPSTPSTVSRPNLTYEEGNALLATCFALTFQSVILADGMVCPSRTTQLSPDRRYSKTQSTGHEWLNN